MKRIYKYPILCTDVAACQEIEIHAGAGILSAGRDPNGDICIWAMIDDTRPMAKKNIYCIYNKKESKSTPFCYILLRSV